MMKGVELGRCVVVSTGSKIREEIPNHLSLVSLRILPIRGQFEDWSLKMDDSILLVILLGKLSEPSSVFNTFAM